MEDNKALKNYDDYKSYYADTSKEDVISDTYIDYLAYINILQELSKSNNKLKEANKYCMEVAKYENEILNEFPSNEFQPEYQINISRLNLVKCILSIIGGE